MDILSLMSRKSCLDYFGTLLDYFAATFVGHGSAQGAAQGPTGLIFIVCLVIIYQEKKINDY